MNKLAVHLWIESIKESKTGIAIIVAIIAVLLWSIYLVSEQNVVTEEVLGEVVNLHQIQDYIGSTHSKFVVRLDDGKEVLVSPPEGTLFRNGRRAKIIKIVKESGRIHHDFVGYTE